MKCEQYTFEVHQGVQWESAPLWLHVGGCLFINLLFRVRRSLAFGPLAVRVAVFRFEMIKQFFLSSAEKFASFPKHLN
jgi:hypothetical protein